ncbi:MAG: hypothetical protein RL042_2381 [Nitrospirota bacterium]|jgi:hypothetical protein
MGRGGWDDPRARATRGLRKPSLDARSWDHPSHPLVSSGSLRPCWTAFLSSPWNVEANFWPAWL